jgi:RNA-directed DNA polymerase
VNHRILKQWLKAGYFEGKQLFPTEEGTPQGGIISPALANWALDGLQERLAKTCGKRRCTNGNKARQKVNLIRYADDFIITGASKEAVEIEVLPVVKAFLEDLALRGKDSHYPCRSGI